MNSKLYNAVDNLLIPHIPFNRATQKILQCLNVAENSSEPFCLALIGESRAGKTRILEHIESKYPKHRTEDGMRIPVLRVTVPATPTIKGLAEEILTALGDPRPDKGTVANMTKRIVTLTREVGTRMIMVDEFQHFYDKEKRKVMHDVADWFKVLVDRCKIALVTAGLKTCQYVLNMNEQLAGRFMAPIYVPRFDWKDDALREEFITILGAFQNGLTQFGFPQLDSDEMAFRFYCASGGLVGYVVKILRQAVWNALDEGKNQIMLEDLAVAYKESVYKDESDLTLPNPFDRGFIVQANENLLKCVALIGTSTHEEPKMRSRRNKKSELSVGEVSHT